MGPWAPPNEDVIFSPESLGTASRARFLLQTPPTPMSSEDLTRPCPKGRRIYGWAPEPCPQHRHRLRILLMILRLVSGIVFFGPGFVRLGLMLGTGFCSARGLVPGPCFVRLRVINMIAPDQTLLTVEFKVAAGITKTSAN